MDNLHVDDGVQHDIDDGQQLGDAVEVIPCFGEIVTGDKGDPLADIQEEPDMTNNIFVIFHIFFWL